MLADVTGLLFEPAKGVLIVGDSHLTPVYRTKQSGLDVLACRQMNFVRLYESSCDFNSVADHVAQLRKYHDDAGSRQLRTHVDTVAFEIVSLSCGRGAYV